MELLPEIAFQQRIELQLVKKERESGIVRRIKDE